MSWLRLTLLKPRSSAEDEALELLQQLDRNLSGSPGLVMSLVATVAPDRIARVALWQSREDADRQAVSDETLALRSRLHYYCTEAEERLLEVRSGFLPSGLSDRLEPVQRYPLKRQLIWL